MLTRFFKNLNDLTLFIQLDATTLNSNHEIAHVHFTYSVKKMT